MLRKSFLFFSINVLHNWPLHNTFASFCNMAIITDRLINFNLIAIFVFKQEKRNNLCGMAEWVKAPLWHLKYDKQINKEPHNYVNDVRKMRVMFYYVSIRIVCIQSTPLCLVTCKERLMMWDVCAFRKSLTKNTKMRRVCVNCGILKRLRMLPCQWD